MPKQKEFYCDDNHNFITTYLWLAAKKFVVEARRHCPNAPCILVGTKTDLRDVGYQLDKQRYLPSVFGEYVARETGCLAYIETSSKTEQGIDELKRAIVRIQTQPEKKKKCELM
jgi:GTPase SAR1 family protein